MEDNQELKIWSRVQGRDTVSQNAAAVAAMYMAERTQAVEYLRLSKEMTGKTERLYTLYRNAQRCAVIVKGVFRLLTEELPGEPPEPAERRNPLPVLRKCFVEEVRQRKTYEGLKNDREYGTVFEELSRYKQENCVLLMEVIGNLHSGS